MRRRGGGRGAGAARGGRGHLARKAERARAEENRRERSIGKAERREEGVGRGAEDVGIAGLERETEERGLRGFDGSNR